MKKKILSILITVLSLCMCMFTLTACGENEPPHTHTYSVLKYDTENHWYECSCGEKKDIENHKGGTATETNKATCSVCNQEYGESLGHVHTLHLTKVDAKPQSCTKEGNREYYTCSCGKWFTNNSATTEITDKTSVVIEKDAHKYETLKKTATEHWWECICGAFETKENHIPGAEATETTDQKCTVCEYVIAPALGHVHTLHLTKVDAKPQSCTQEGNVEYYTCSCGKWFTDNTATTEITDKTSVVVAKDKHNYTILKQSSTQHWYECVCGDKKDIEKHKPGAEATETTAQKCTVCNYVITPALGHVHTLHLTKVDAKPQSCTQEGNKEYYTCSCGKWFTNNSATTEITDKTSVVIAKDAHKYETLKKTITEHWYECICGAYETKENHIPGAEATETTDQKCTVCQYVIAPALGHVHTLHLTKVDAKPQSCTQEGNVEYYTCSCGKWFTDNTATTEITDKTSVVVGKDTHNYNTLKHNELQHWKECICGAYETKENHKPGAAATETTDQKCTECNYVIAPALGHVHTLHLTKVDAKPQSCTQEGNVEYYTCSCGKWFTDNTATTEILDKASVVIQKDAHEYTILKNNETAHWNECVCGDKANIEGHKGGIATCTAKAKCEVCDVEYGSLKPHEYNTLKKDTTNHWYECTCGDKDGLEEHHGGNATCTEKAVCDDCGVEYGSLEKHNYTELKQSATQHWYECTCGDKKDIENHKPGAEATETTDQKCTECGYVITPALGHVHTLHLTKVDAKPQSCTQEGNREYYTCSCGKWFTNNSATTEITDKTSVVIEKDAHKYETLKKTATEHWWECSCGDKDGLEEHHGGNATCTEKAVCVDCGLEYGYLEKHKYEELKNSETEHWYECECGDKTNIEGHKGGTATCTQKARCSVCGVGYGNVLGHDYDTEVTVPTCTEQGYTTYTCHCGDSYVDDYVNAKGHNYVDYFCMGCGVEFYTEGLSFGIINNDTEYSVTDYNGTSAEVYIPNIYNGKPVTCIGESAFAYCSSLQLIYLSNSLKIIDEKAFMNCSGLTAIEVPSTVNMISKAAFKGCKSLQKIALPFVGDGNENKYFAYVFGEDYKSNELIPTSLKNVVIAGGKIFNDSFYYCNYIKEIILLDDVTSIGNCAFYSCSALNKISIGSGVKTIGSYAFYNCFNLKEIAFSQESCLKSIGNNAFDDCDSLINLTIPSTVERIGYRLFYNTTITHKVNYLGSIDQWVEIDFEGPIWDDFPKTEVYFNGEKLVHGKITSASKISKNAFRGCTTLQTLEISSSIDTIADRAFYGCDSLISIVVPRNVITVGNETFYGCDSLTIYCKEESQPEGWNATWNSSNCPVYWYRGTQESVPADGGNYWHYNEKGEIESWHSHLCEGVVVKPTCTEQGYTTYTCHCGYSYIDNYVVALGHTEVIDTAIAPTCTKTGLTEGKHCSVCETVLKEQEIVNVLGHDYDTEVTVPTCTEQGYTTYTCHCGDSYVDNYVDELGHAYGEWISNGDDTHTKTCANDNNHKVTEDCTIHEATCMVKAGCDICAATGNNFADHVYENERCKWCNASEGLKYKLSNNSYIVSGIGTCNHTDIVIPSTYNGKPVTSIGNSAFYDCDALTSIEIPSSVTSIGKQAFQGSSNLQTVKLGENSQLTSVGSYAFEGCPKLQYNIKGNLKYLGNSGNSYLYLAGVANKNITTANIDNDCKIIGNYAFSSCTSLEAIEIPSSVTSIGYMAFEDCSNLQTVTFGENSQLTRIADEVFYNCSSLTSIEIPSSVTSIGKQAFIYCTLLRSIEIPSSVTSISSMAFYDCSSLTSIVIPNSVKSIGEYAFYNCSKLTSIKYRGTASQWQAITKGTKWNYNTGNYTITYNYTGE